MRSILYALCLLIAIAPGLAQQTKPEEPIYKIEKKDVKPPRPISSPQPDFSADARRGKFKGVVVVTGYVGTDGKFHDAKVLQSIGDSVLDAKVLAAVKKWTFHPCTRDDKPVNCTMNIETAIHLY
jgi:protein TonB